MDDATAIQFHHQGPRQARLQLRPRAQEGDGMTTNTNIKATGPYETEPLDCWHQERRAAKAEARIKITAADQGKPRVRGDADATHLQSWDREIRATWWAGY